MGEIFKQFIIFCGVGSINTAVGLAIILFLSEVLDYHYILANFLGYMAGLMIGFILHRSITFKQTADNTRIGAELFSFINIFIAAYLLQLIALMMMVQFFNVIEWVAQILAIGIYTAFNYFGNRMRTFRKQKQKQDQADG